MGDMTVPRVLTIAGSDSGGGAGIQADLKTFTAFGCYGTSVITALTSQNTIGVNGIVGVEPAFVQQQLRSVLQDIGTDAIKLGMLYSPEIINVIRQTLDEAYPKGLPFLVLDPVMVSTSNHPLVSTTHPFIDALISKLLPISTLVTPNLSEAENLAQVPRRWILDHEMGPEEAMKLAAIEIAKKGARNVLIKGGHLGGDIVDILLEYRDGNESVWTMFRHRKLTSKNVHGTGCHLASAIAANIALGLSIREAVQKSVDFIQTAIMTSFPVGKGNGPINALSTIVPRSVPLASKDNPFPLTSILIERNGKDTWEKYTKTHPFVAGLKDGTLSRERFIHFLKQDYLFLTQYARVHALAAYKADNLDDIDGIVKIVAAITRECRKHVEKCKGWGIKDVDFYSAKESDMTVAYTRYVLDIGNSQSLLALRAAVYPCLIGYGEMGLYLARDATDDNPYIQWIRDYAGEEFQEAVKTGRELLENSVRDNPISLKELDKLVEIFGRAVRLEIGFWQQAWDMS